MRVSIGGTKYCSIVAVLGRNSIYAALLAATCLLVFAPAYTAGVTNWDDDFYLRPSPIFTTFVMGSYHPLTVISFAISGRNPIVLHVINVVLHSIAAILVFVFLEQLVGAGFPAFAGALMWAIHPMKVESVVWIAGRKDVLCGIFYVAALIAYVKNRRWLTFALFVCALLSKGTAVSLPLALLAIDFLQRRRMKIVEKTPLFALSILFGVIGFFAQRIPGPFAEAQPSLSLMEKFAFSCRAFFFYIGKLLLPVKLSAFYPYPKSVTFADWIAPLLIIILAVFAIRVRSVAFAFFFFLVTIAVAFPIFLVGRTIAADRFTYIPSIALAYLIALAVKPRLVPLIAIVAALLGGASFNRSRVWHDSVALWTSVIEYDPTLALPYNNRAVAFVEQGDNAGALRDLNASIAIDPCYAMALNNRMIVALRLGDSAAASRDRDRLSRCRK
jgi:protein O-mannosyl-transferase